MRGLFFKIFGILWLAQSLIAIISIALIVRQRFPSPNIMSDAFEGSLQRTGTDALRAYEAAGCSGFTDNAARYEPFGASLLDENGQQVCRTANAGSLAQLHLHFPDHVDGRQIDGNYVWLVPLKSASGHSYEYVWYQPPSTSQQAQRRPRRGLIHFAFPQLPVAIAVGGLTTFVLVLLFSRPLVRLRVAARQLAEGNLGARVEVAPARAGAASDEFQGLALDFNHMAERLESLVAAQKLLLRDVSHELRSPLARLSVALELAHEDAPPELSQHLTRIEREAERLNQLIGQLLTLSSMETRENARPFEPVSLNALCERIVPDAEYEAKQRSCTVVLKEEGEVIVPGDRELLYRAIENVVRNAIRYTTPGTQVALRVAKFDAGGQQVFAKVEVSDHGPGIPEEDMQQIFEPFYRVDRARNSATGGFGVGLAITERAVRLHGGNVQVMNRPQGGTQVTLTFPIPLDSANRTPGSLRYKTEAKS